MNSGEGITEFVWPAWAEQIEMDELEQLAGVGFTPEKIAMYYKINTDEFMRVFLTHDSKLKYHFDRGILMYQAKEGMATLQSAVNGNTTQAQRLDKIRKNIDFEEHKKSIIYGE